MRKNTPEQAAAAKARIKEYLHLYYLAHKDKALSEAKAWAEANPEKKQAASLKSRVKRRLVKNQHAREVYAADPTKKSVQARLQYLKNRDRRLEVNKAWRLANPELAAHHSRVRRGLKNGGKFTAKEFSDLCNHYGNVCLCCWRSAGLAKLTADHVLPLSKGGSNDISNIQPLCKSCNCKKHAKHIDYRLDTLFAQPIAA